MFLCSFVKVVQNAECNAVDSKGKKCTGAPMLKANPQVSAKIYFNFRLYSLLNIIGPVGGTSISLLAAGGSRSSKDHRNHLIAMHSGIAVLYSLHFDMCRDLTSFRIHIITRITRILSRCPDFMCTCCRMSILFPIYHCLGCLKALLLTFNFEHHELTSTFLFRAFVRLRLCTQAPLKKVFVE
jgi:hypothetical protein